MTTFIRLLACTLGCFFVLSTSIFAQDLTKAVQQSDLTLVKQLLNNGSDPDRIDASGRTALIIASGIGNQRMVSLLLKHGANVNLAGTDGSTPLITASKSGYIDMVNLLLDNGADIYLQDCSKMNAYDYCMETDWDASSSANGIDYPAISQRLRDLLDHK